MASNNDINYTMNYVYTPVGTTDLKTLEVVIKIINSCVNLTLVSDEMIDEASMPNVIKGLQKNLFNKMKLDILNDCDINIIVDNTKYEIEYKDNSFVIK